MNPITWLFGTEDDDAVVPFEVSEEVPAWLKEEDIHDAGTHQETSEDNSWVRLGLAKLHKRRQG